MIVLRKIKKATSNQTIAEPLLGATNGVNRTFTTLQEFNPDKICVFFNGQELISPYDFEVVGANEIEFIYITPESWDVLNVSYEIA